MRMFIGVGLVAIAIAEHSEDYSMAVLIVGAFLIAWKVESVARKIEKLRQ
jgi:hypothetical protein